MRLFSKKTMNDGFERGQLHWPAVSSSLKLDQLPKEMLFSIANFLDIESLITFAMLNKRTREIGRNVFLQKATIKGKPLLTLPLAQKMPAERLYSILVKMNAKRRKKVTQFEQVKWKADLVNAAPESYLSEVGEETLGKIGILAILLWMGSGTLASLFGISKLLTYLFNSHNKPLIPGKVVLGTAVSASVTTVAAVGLLFSYHQRGKVYNQEQKAREELEKVSVLKLDHAKVCYPSSL